MRHQFLNLFPERVQNRITARLPPFISSFEVSLPNGTEILITDIHQSEVFKKLYWRGVQGFEWDAVKLFCVISETSEFIFDIGAYIGYYSLLAGKMNPSASITAFEPHIGNINLLKKLIELNGINVLAENIALGNETGIVKFYVPDRPHSKLPNIGSLKNRFKPGAVFSNRGSIPVDVTSFTLDDYCKERKIEKIDLIKIDAEGFELEIFSSGLNVIRNSKPDIIGEISEHETDFWGDVLHKFDYRFFDITETGLVHILDPRTLVNARRDKKRGWYGEIFSTCKSDAEIDEINRKYLAIS